MTAQPRPFITQNGVAATFITQLLLLGLFGSCLCGNEPFLICLATLGGFWSGFAIAARRRAQSATLADVLYIWLGYPALLFLAFHIAEPVLTARHFLFHY